MPRRSQRRTRGPVPSVAGSLNLNQIVGYNLRAAREMQGWTQEELAERLAERTGKSVSQSAISALERSWDGGRKREFDVHELALYAVTLDVPVLWFLLPPPNDFRPLEDLDLSVLNLYVLLLGRNDQMGPMLKRCATSGSMTPHPKTRSLRTSSVTQASTAR